MLTFDLAAQCPLCEAPCTLSPIDAGSAGGSCSACGAVLARVINRSDGELMVIAQPDPLQLDKALAKKALVAAGRVRDNEL